MRALKAQPLAVLAGGTDYYAQRVGRPLTDDVLDITALAELRGVEERDGCLSLGALITWSDLIEAPLPPLLNALKQAAREVGGVQVQVAGTVAGNLCNASPAADGVPVLLALDAQAFGGVNFSALTNQSNVEFVQLGPGGVCCQGWHLAHVSKRETRPVAQG